ncbi:15511_t:CDS:2, partial [Acaulospora morrowiae]
MEKMPETTMISTSHWLEKVIDQEYLNFHDFDKFSDLVPVGDGPLGKVYRAQWQIRGMVVALKSWIDETSKEEKRILDEFMNELKMHRKVDYHPNILRFYGLSKGNNDYYNFFYVLAIETNHHLPPSSIHSSFNNLNSHILFIHKDVCSKKYLLVLEYADGGTLRQYLKQNHSSLTWADRINLARQVTSGVACLHDNGILLGDLHANNILVKDGAIKISDISLSKQFSRISDAVSGAKGDIAYVEPQNLKSLQYEPNDKSDIYSIGVLLWEISSGRPPFQTSAPPTAMSQIQIATRISNGEREEPVKDSP